jgi:hypothetical protein
MDDETVSSPIDPGRSDQTIRRSALGRYAWMNGSSDDFAKEKQAEIEREEKRTP